MKYVIDRFEGNIAVCEDEYMKHIEIDKSLLPVGAGEGSSIIVDAGGVISLFDDHERVRRIAEKMKKIWK